MNSSASTLSGSPIISLLAVRGTGARLEKSKGDHASTVRFCKRGPLLRHRRSAGEALGTHGNGNPDNKASDRDQQARIG